MRYPCFRKGARVVVPIKEKASYGRQCHAVLSYFDICAQDICDIDLYTVFYHYYVCRLCNVINRGPSGELHGFTQGKRFAKSFQQIPKEEAVSHLAQQSRYKKLN